MLLSCKAFAPKEESTKDEQKQKEECFGLELSSLRFVGVLKNTFLIK